MGLTVRCVGGSNIGLVRNNNEDSAYAGRWLCAVADGLGGHVGGEVASATVIETLRSYDAQVAATDLAGTLARAVSEANDMLRRKVEADPKLRGMGTTLTAMLWSGSHAVLAHIGDSRAYLLREGRLSQITEDHTLGGLLDTGVSVRLSSVLVRYLDGRRGQSPDIPLRELRPGDRYLLCSDGLSGVVTPETMREVLASAEPADKIVRQLIDRANDGGGPDNITVVVADVSEADGEQKAPVEPTMLGAAADARAGRA